VDLLVSGVFILVIAAVNSWATLRVVRDRLLSTNQKRVQLALIWLLPVLGVLFVLMFRPSDAIYAPRFPQAGVDRAETGIDPSLYRDRSAAWDESHHSHSTSADDSSSQ
jgi:hypothetical protein